MKLLKIEIQSFDGQLDLWSEFYENFQYAIYQNSSLSDIQNTTYLKSLLRGSVSSTIPRFKSSNENYSVPLNSLKECFDNKKLQIAVQRKICLKVPEFLI